MYFKDELVHLLKRNVKLKKIFFSRSLQTQKLIRMKQVGLCTPGQVMNFQDETKYNFPCKELALINTLDKEKRKKKEKKLFEI